LPAPAVPGSSYIVLKLEGSSRQSSGAQMPFGGPARCRSPRSTSFVNGSATAPPNAPRGPRRRRGAPFRSRGELPRGSGAGRAPPAGAPSWWPFSDELDASLINEHDRTSRASRHLTRAPSRPGPDLPCGSPRVIPAHTADHPAPGALPPPARYIRLTPARASGGGCAWPTWNAHAPSASTTSVNSTWTSHHDQRPGPAFASRCMALAWVFAPIRNNAEPYPRRRPRAASAANATSTPTGRAGLRNAFGDVFRADAAAGAPPGYRHGRLGPAEPRPRFYLHRARILRFDALESSRFRTRARLRAVFRCSRRVSTLGASVIPRTACLVYVDEQVGRREGRLKPRSRGACSGPPDHSWYLKGGQLLPALWPAPARIRTAFRRPGQRQSTWTTPDQRRGVRAGSRDTGDAQPRREQRQPPGGRGPPSNRQTVERATYLGRLFCGASVPRPTTTMPPPPAAGVAWGVFGGLKDRQGPPGSARPI